jgi:hypothetical protein
VVSVRLWSGAKHAGGVSRAIHGESGLWEEVAWAATMQGPMERVEQRPGMRRLVGVPSRQVHGSIVLMVAEDDEGQLGQRMKMVG